MAYYGFIKSAHIYCVVLSIGLFIVRGLWIIVLRKDWSGALWLNLPRLVDSLLLLSAITLMILSGLYPGVYGWITVKLLFVLIYIFLGMVALHWAKRRSYQLMAFVFALLSVFYVVGIALSKNPVFFIAHA